MVEKLLEELRNTKEERSQLQEELDAVRKEKADTEERLEQEVSIAREFWYAPYYRTVRKNHKLQEQLAQAQKQVKINADAKEKLEQLRKQWSAISTTLSFEDTASDSGKTDAVSITRSSSLPPSYTPHE